MLVLAFAAITQTIWWNTLPVSNPKPEIYNIPCQNCGTIWQSKNNETITHCPECPSTFCMKGAQMVMALGSLNEIVSHQPNNAEAKQKRDDLIKKLEIHLKECDGCRQEFKK